jgi:hypothetical protein
MDHAIPRDEQRVARARAALVEAVGDAADEIELQEAGGALKLTGAVDDAATRARAVSAVAAAAGPVSDALQVRPDWGEEAEPKRTEFGTRDSARAMTTADFDRID